METDRKSTAWWFVIGMVSTMLLCICLGMGLLGAGLITKAVGWLTSQEMSVETPLEISPSPTKSPSSTPEQETRIPLGESKLELAYQTKELLSNTNVPENDPISLAERFRGHTDIPRVLAESAEPIPVGTVQSFWVSNLDDNSNFEVQAKLAYATEHVYFWVEEGIDYQETDLEALVEFFDTEAYPTNRDFFGHEWEPGVDGDPHLYILYAGNLGYSVAGYYSPADELSPLAHEYSNGHEMFYLNSDNVYLWEEFAYGVLAHEFQHMIHWYYDRNEDTWLNEGMSELAALLNDYYVGGFDNAYLSDPDQTLSFWPGSGESGRHYGQAFLFVTYFMDRFGAEVTRRVVEDPVNGLESIDRTLASLGMVDDQGAPFRADDLYGDWAAALWIQDSSVDDGRYDYESYRPAQPSIADTFPCPVSAQSREVSQYGIDYVRFDCEGEHTLIFDGEEIVTVVPVEPHSGQSMFWSNRGDESDMTLTRTFDLSGVEGSAELDYWVWYDIEEGWDYLYLLASLDDGDTWQILTTPSGTGEDTSGNAYGWAYTGYSGGGELPTWIQESVDLSAFTGQEIQLRLEYITDAAVHGEGLLLDDLSIEAIGYEEDFEESEGGWKAEGFVRLYNRLPQTFRVMLVEEGLETRVRQISLDADNHAEISIDLSGVYGEAVLIVMGTTRHTWQSAPYQITVVP